jgi:hypothetical protein
MVKPRFPYPDRRGQKIVFEIAVVKKRPNFGGLGKPVISPILIADKATIAFSREGDKIRCVYPNWDARRVALDGRVEAHRGGPGGIAATLDFMKNLLLAFSLDSRTLPDRGNS